MARDRRHKFLDHWHEHTLDLEDGRRLRWGVIDEPGRRVWIPWFRIDGEGGLHHSEGKRLLVEHGHPDAALPTMGDEPGASARLHR